MTIAELPVDNIAVPGAVENRTLKLLVVEDCEADFDLLEATLARQQIPARCQRVETESQMQSALGAIAPDAIICDHHLPDFSSDRALQVLRESGLQLPFLIVSGTIGEDAAVAAMRAGADDYLIKGRLARLGVALTNAISAVHTRRQRQLAEEKLRQSEEQLRALSDHLLNAVEMERTAMARDIHDEIGSGLTAIGLDLAWIARRGTKEISARTRLVQNQVSDLQQTGQRIVRNLRPPVLDAGLIPALEWQIRNFRQCNQIKTHFDCANPEIPVGDTVAMVVYRTLQEALTNISKHAEADCVDISLVIQPDSVSMEISDDGIGIQGTVQPGSGQFGLRGLTERARLAGGWLDVCPNPSSGTSLLLSLPISNAPRATNVDQDHQQS